MESKANKWEPWYKRCRWCEARVIVPPEASPNEHCPFCKQPEWVKKGEAK